MFGQFDDWLDPGLLLPIRGQEFRANPSARTVLTLHRQRVDDEALTRGNERDAVRAILGGAWDEMAAAGIPDVMALHAGRTALVHYLKSADDSIAVWHFTDPERPEPEPEVKRGPSIKGVDPDDSVDPPGTINDYDPGGGPYIPDLGIRVWANPMEYAPAFRQQRQEAVEREQPTWSDILEVWDAVEVDFAHILRIDLTPELLDSRPWRWFAVRISRIIGDPDTLTSRLINVRKAVQ